MATDIVPNRGLLRRKPIGLILRQSEDTRGLRRALGTLSLTAIGIGDIIGAGIFVTTGVAAAKYAGPGIVLSYVVAGIVSGLAALCYAEFASSVPIAGSAYTYSYATLGELIAWIIGWDLILEYCVGAATVAIGWSGYFVDLLHGAFGITLPEALTASPFAGGILNIPALVIVLLITFVLITGTSQSSTVNTIIVAIKLLVIGFFIAVGVFHVNSANWHPFLPYGIGGILHGASIIFFAYVGFDIVSTAAEEARNPAKTLPRAILISLGVCTLLYMLVAAILTGIVPFPRLNVASPVSHALLLIGLGWASVIISIGALAGLTTVLLIDLYAQSRVFFAMARDGLLPSFFGRLHPRLRTPYLTSLLVGVVVAAVAALTPIDVVVELVNIGTLAAFILVSIGVLVLRRTAPDLRRGFRVPLVPLVPVLSVLASFVLIVGLPGITIIRFLVWLAIGLAIYFLYSRHHSRLARGQPEASEDIAPPEETLVP